jgi:hypothetical protein
VDFLAYAGMKLPSFSLYSSLYDCPRVAGAAIFALAKMRARSVNRYGSININ